MKRLLNLDLFTQVSHDLEKRQYLVLADLKKATDLFDQHRIYPHLSQLVELFRTLEKLQEQINNTRDEMPKRITNIDLQRGIIEKEPIYIDPSNIDEIDEFIEWTKPHLRSTIDQGIEVFEFVDSNLSIEKVGIVPDYQYEGYFFIPDNQAQQLRLYQYETSIFQSSTDKYRSIKTSFLKTLDFGGAHWSPNSIKLDLIRENRDLPNPATYALETDLEYPFKPTIFPVAKRKLMRYLFS